MLKIKYVNHENQSFVLGDFDGKSGTLVNENDLRSYSWGYSAQYNKLRSFYKDASTKTIGVRVFGANSLKIANDIYAIIEKDVIALEEGRLYYGDYYIKGYFYAMDSPTKKQDVLSFNLGFVSAFPYWLKDSDRFRFGFDAGVGQGEFLDYPHGYDYDYSQQMSTTKINNTNFTDTDFKMTIFGEAVNPTVYIDNHMYRVNVTMQNASDSLVIDSLNKTITLNENGNIINLFDERERESYIFEKLPSGELSVSWDSHLKIEVVLIEKRSEPKWI